MTVVNLDGQQEEKKEEPKKRKAIHPGVEMAGGGQLKCKKCWTFFTIPHDGIIGFCICGIWVESGREIRWIRFSSGPVRLAGPGESFELTAP